MKVQKVADLIYLQYTSNNNISYESKYLYVKQEKTIQEFLIFHVILVFGCILFDAI